MSSSSPIFPLEVLDIIAQHLVGDHAYATGATLNITSKAVRQATLQTLWTHMYWTAYHDSSKYKKEEVEERWKVFKASAGAKYIRFMIEPPLFKSQIRDPEQPAVSKSLSKTLKAAVTLVGLGSSSEIQVHLCPKYTYSSMDMASVLRAVDVAITFPSFANISEVAIHVHSTAHLPNLPSTDDKATAALPDAGTDVKKENQVGGNVLFETPSLTTPQVSPWLRTISLVIPQTVKLKEEKYAALLNHVMTLLRPYMKHGAQGRGEAEAAEFIMGDIRIAPMLSFAAAFVQLCDADPLNATVEFLLFLHYNEDTGKPMPNGKQLTQLRNVLGLAKGTFKRASRTIPLKVLGHFHISNHRETVCADVRIDADKKQMETIFGYGIEDMNREVESLEDAPMYTDAEGNA